MELSKEAKDKIFHNKKVMALIESILYYPYEQEDREEDVDELIRQVMKLSFKLAKSKASKEKQWI